MKASVRALGEQRSVARHAAIAGAKEAERLRLASQSGEASAAESEPEQVSQPRSRGGARKTPAVAQKIAAAPGACKSSAHKRPRSKEGGLDSEHHSPKSRVVARRPAASPAASELPLPPTHVTSSVPAPPRVNELDALHSQLIDAHRLKHNKEPTSAEWFRLRNEAGTKLAVVDSSLKRSRKHTRLFAGMLSDPH